MPAPTLVLLRSVVVVDWFPVPLSFAQFARQVFLLLLVVVAQQLLPVIWIHVLLLFDDLTLDLLGLETPAKLKVGIYADPYIFTLPYNKLLI